MKLVYTEQALKNLQEVLEFIVQESSVTEARKVRDTLLEKADLLIKNPELGQKEEYLDHLGLSHRRIVESHYKIIYRIIGEAIYVTDIFDTRQDPDKMKG